MSAGTLHAPLDFIEGDEESKDKLRAVLNAPRGGSAVPALQMGSVVFGPGTAKSKCDCPACQRAESVAAHGGVLAKRGKGLTAAEVAAFSIDQPVWPKKGIWVVVDKEEKAIAFMLTKGLNGPQQAVARSIRLRADGRFSSTMADAWKEHGVAVVYAVDKQARFWEAAQAVAPVPLPKAVWMAME